MKGAESNSSESHNRRKECDAALEANVIVRIGEQQPNEEEPLDIQNLQHAVVSNDSYKDTKDSSIIVTISDPDVLVCPICFDSLGIPLYQCDNGHVACSACRLNLEKKCATCSSPIGFNRCRALEKVLESIKIPCPNAEYGCKETLSYSDKKKHELECIYVPCSCPIADCEFVSSSEVLSLHLCNNHHGVEIFVYDIPFPFTLKSDGESIFLQEGTEGNMFILHNYVLPSVGNAISVSCIGPNCKPSNQYDILAKSQGCSLELKSFAKNIQRSDVGTLSSSFLLIPFDYFGASGTRKVEICIRSGDGLKI